MNLYEKVAFFRQHWKYLIFLSALIISSIERDKNTGLKVANLKTFIKKKVTSHAENIQTLLEKVILPLSFFPRGNH